VFCLVKIQEIPGSKHRKAERTKVGYCLTMKKRA
jgi:hypothetical protein